MGDLITCDPNVAIVSASLCVRLSLEYEIIVRRHGLHEWKIVYKHFQLNSFEVKKVIKKNPDRKNRKSVKHFDGMSNVKMEKSENKNQWCYFTTINDNYYSNII